MEVWEFTDRTEVMRKLTHTEDCRRCWTQWSLKDANGAKRCLAIELLLPNVCMMDRKRGLVLPDVID